MGSRLILSLLLILALNKAVTAHGFVTTGYPNSELLVDVEWLKANLHAEELHIIDMRSEGFEDGHIPGAVNIPGTGALVDQQNEIEHFLVDARQFEKIMGEIGINEQASVVIYDEGDSRGSARLFYALEYYGHQGKQRILNGGFKAWEFFNGPVNQGSAAFVSPVTYHSNTQEDLVCDISYLRENLNAEHIVVFDARTPEEFRGENRLAAQAGHIPGAVNIEWSRSLQDGDIPFFKPAEEIAEMLLEHGITPDKEVIPHCHSNVRGSHVYFTLRLMGYDSVRPYEGSWSEYGNTEGVRLAR